MSNRPYSVMFFVIVLSLSFSLVRPIACTKEEIKDSPVPASWLCGPFSLENVKIRVTEQGMPQVYSEIKKEFVPGDLIFWFEPPEGLNPTGYCAVGFAIVRKCKWHREYEVNHLSQGIRANEPPKKNGT